MGGLVQRGRWTSVVAQRPLRAKLANEGALSSSWPLLITLLTVLLVLHQHLLRQRPWSGPVTLAQPTTSLSRHPDTSQSQAPLIQTRGYEMAYWRPSFDVTRGHSVMFNTPASSWDVPYSR